MRAQDFKLSRQRLKFLLGEFSLFSVDLHFLEYDRHFLEIDRGIEEVELPRDDDPRISGIYFSSFPIQHPLPLLSFSRGRLRYCPFQYTRHYIPGQGSFQDYLDQFSSKSRSTLRRKVRKYDTFCGTEDNWKEFRSQEEMKEFHRLAREVSKKTYQERLLDAGLPTADWFRQRMLELAASNLVRGYILFHEDKPVAFLYCPIVHGRIFLYAYVGYDPAYKQWSPGTVLQFKVLQKLFAEQEDFIFDFYEGQGPHKEFFARRHTLCAAIYYFRIRPKNVLLVITHLILRQTSKALVWVLAKFRLKARIKRMIRLRFARASDGQAPSGD